MEPVINALALIISLVFTSVISLQAYGKGRASKIVVAIAMGFLSICYFVFGAYQVSYKDPLNGWISVVFGFVFAVFSLISLLVAQRYGDNGEW